MEQISPNEFRLRTAVGKARRTYDYTAFYGETFECGCGDHHPLRPWMEVMSELPLFRFVVACPRGFHLTLVKARWDLEQGVRILRSELGTELGDKRDSKVGIEFQAGLLEARTGRPWSLEKTEIFMDLQHNAARQRRRAGAE